MLEFDCTVILKVFIIRNVFIDLHYDFHDVETKENGPDKE